MLNKNDPLIGAVQEVMKRNHAEREAARLVNEKFGVHDRKALPHEKQSEWDAAYKQVLSEGISVELRPDPKTQPETKVTGGQGIQAYDKSSRSSGPNSPRPHGNNPKVSMDETLHRNQQKLDLHEPEKDKLTKHDFKMLRAKAASGELEEAQMNIDAAVAARKMSSMANKAKTPEEREELLAKMRKYQSQVKMQKEETVEEMVNPTSAPTSQTPASTVRKAAVKQNVRMGGNPTGAASSQTPASTVRKAAVKQNVRMGGNPTGSPVRPSSSKSPMEEDVTSPSEMGIKGPDYAPAGTKPDYTVRNTVGPKSDLIKKPTMSSGNSTVTQTGKTSSSATKSTMKEENLEEKITAKTDIGSAIEDFKKSKSPRLAGRSEEKRREAAIAAVLQARRKAKEKMNEGFNNRHNSSANASAGKQVVAEAVPGTPAAQAAANRSNSMLIAQQRVRNAEAIQSRLAAQRSRSNAASTTDVAPRPQPNMALQRQQAGNVAPRPQQGSVALQRQQAGNVAPRPQQGSVALQRQRTGDIAPRPSTAAAPKPADRPNDLGKAPVPGTGGRLAPAAPATAPKPTAKPVQAARKPAAAAPVKNASTRGGTMSQRDANLLARAKAGGGQRLSTTFKSGRERLGFFAARNAERRGP